MWDFKKEFQRELRGRLGEAVEKLFDLKVELGEREIFEGWRCFHAELIWCREHLPPPMVNDLGRRFSCEQLMERLHENYNEASGYFSDFLRAFFESVEARTGYRNCFESARDYDPTFGAVRKSFLEDHHRHPDFEIKRNQTRWLLEAENWASQTPPFLRAYKEKNKPERDESLSLESDNAYWREVYSDGFTLVTASQDFLSGEWTRILMARIAPDFPFSQRLSAKSRLVFAKESPGMPAWTIVFDKGFGVHYPPRLFLLSPSLKRWSDSDVLFEDPLRLDRVINLHAARGMEIFLLYILPRYRKLLRFYQPFVDDALRAL